MQQPRDFSLYGAVDLSARQAAAQRKAAATRAASSPAPAAGEAGAPAGDEETAFVFDVTEQTFNADVALRSRTTPVIIDLWAEWCGPCKQLSPVLEKLASEAKGAWVLAKIDVDANPRLAQAFQAQSIPMVVAIIGGQMVDAFLGVMPEAQIRQWLTQVLAVADQLGVAGEGDGAAAAPAADEMPDAYDEARDAMDKGDLDGAAAILEKALSDAPGDAVAKSWLNQVNLMRRVTGYDPAAVSRAAAQSPDDPEAQIRLADMELASGRAEDAFDRLLGVIRRTSGEARNSARVHLLELFEIFPPGDPAVKAARTRLASLLF
jgi:putative thioredoxin